MKQSWNFIDWICYWSGIGNLALYFWSGQHSFSMFIAVLCLTSVFIPKREHKDPR